MSKRKNRNRKVFTGESLVIDAIDPVAEVGDVACMLRFMAETVPLSNENTDYDAIAAKGLRLSLGRLADRLEVAYAVMARKPLVVAAD